MACRAKAEGRKRWSSARFLPPDAGSAMVAPYLAARRVGEAVHLVEHTHHPSSPFTSIAKHRLPIPLEWRTCDVRREG